MPEVELLPSCLKDAGFTVNRLCAWLVEHVDIVGP